jgi:hypothetical protein
MVSSTNVPLDLEIFRLRGLWLLHLFLISPTNDERLDNFKNGKRELNIFRPKSYIYFNEMFVTWPIMNTF